MLSAPQLSHETPPAICAQVVVRKGAEGSVSALAGSQAPEDAGFDTVAEPDFATAAGPGVVAGVAYTQDQSRPGGGLCYRTSGERVASAACAFTRSHALEGLDLEVAVRCDAGKVDRCESSSHAAALRRRVQFQLSDIDAICVPAYRETYCEPLFQLEIVPSDDAGTSAKDEKCESHV